jgi:hypothetical protein
MRNGIFVALLVLPHLTVLLHAQSGARYFVLPGRESRQLSQLCSRPGPKVAGGWQPNRGDINALDKRLFLVSKLASTSGMVGIHIAHPERYYRQYVGIVVEHRNLIYVNAFSTAPSALGIDDPKQFGSGFEGVSELPSDWRERLVNPCDGGIMFWGAVYDPKTQQFFDLATNTALPVPPPPPKR